MTIAVDLGRKATKPTNQPTNANIPCVILTLKLTLSSAYIDCVILTLKLTLCYTHCVTLALKLTLSNPNTP